MAGKAKMAANFQAIRKRNSIKLKTKVTAKTCMGMEGEGIHVNGLKKGVINLGH